jgi:hypothetical protein
MAERRKVVDSISLSSAHSMREFLDVILSSFPDRSGVIVRERYGVTDGREKTLEEIGQVHGITRERVRQIVDVIMKRIKDIVSREREHLLIRRVIDMVKGRGGVVAVDDLLKTLGGRNIREEKALSALLPSLPGITISKEIAKRKSVVIADGFSMDEWEEMIAMVALLLEEVNDVQSLEELYALYVKKSGDQKIEKEAFDFFLLPSTEIEKNVFGRYGLSHWSAVRPRGTRERAHLILQVMKKPLHFREIARLIDEHGLYKTGKKTHPQTVHNELIKDVRFVLVGRGTYALSDWGYRPGTVREVLSSILKEKEAPMSREELLKAVMKVRQVKRSTVIINLNSFFTKVGKNIYSLSEKKK